MKHLLILAFLFPQWILAIEPCRIEVVEKESGWPVPMVELRTSNHVSFYTDNAGVAAFDLPELLGKETWLHVGSHGYEVPADGFGFRGTRFIPEPGRTHRIEIKRLNVARRLGRMTGSGLFAESQKLGEQLDWKESGVLGSDSVNTAIYNNKLYWAWGDTNLAHYPLGIFHTSSATTSLKPLQSFEPPLRLHYQYFRDDNKRPRSVAKLPGEGPTWLSGYVALPDKDGRIHLVATYSKIKPPLDTYETGLCRWNDETSNFEAHRVLWNRRDTDEDKPPVPHGHPVFWTDESGKRWLMFGNPLPTLQMPATYEAWQEPKTWTVLSPQDSLPSAEDNKPIKLHSGSIAWNSWRKKWVTVFMQHFGRPSAFGELWYAEADLPTGPWGTAVKVLTHDNYSFYNPRLHPELTDGQSPILLFEGTYTRLFANKPAATPRYEYNQMLYRLDLDDPRLAPAQKQEG